jgi:hypothetical protein
MYHSLATSVDCTVRRLARDREPEDAGEELSWQLIRSGANGGAARCR